MSDRELRRLSLRRLFDMRDDIPHVNPMCVPPEADGKTPPQSGNPPPPSMTPEQRELYNRIGRVEV